MSVAPSPEPTPPAEEDDAQLNRRKDRDTELSFVPHEAQSQMSLIQSMQARRQVLPPRAASPSSLKVFWAYIYVSEPLHIPRPDPKYSLFQAASPESISLTPSNQPLRFASAVWHVLCGPGCSRGGRACRPGHDSSAQRRRSAASGVQGARPPGASRCPATLVACFIWRHERHCTFLCRARSLLKNSCVCTKR